MTAQGQEEPFQNAELNDREGEGFRMPACGDLSARAEGRRPKASQDGTRGGRILAAALARMLQEGRAIPLCTDRLAINPVGYGESVVNLNAQIAHRAFYPVELDCLVPRAGP